MYLPEALQRDSIRRKEIKQAAAHERSRPKEGSPAERFFDSHFDLLQHPDPRQLHVSLLGKAVAAGVQARERTAVKVINKAAKIADEAHKNQTRQLSSDPYIVHPYRSAFLAIEFTEAMGIPITTELIVGAILHDTVEDNPNISEAYLFNEFKEHGVEFAKRVAGDAEALSRYTHGEKIETDEYIEKIKNAPSAATLLRRLIIKSSDRIDNLLDPARSPMMNDETDELWRKRTKIIKKTSNDLLPLLHSETPDMPIATEYLLGIVNRALHLSQATLDVDNFDPKQWKNYLPEAA
jgi:hypothetical protein